jgi:hypothetical protein
MLNENGRDIKCLYAENYGGLKIACDSEEEFQRSISHVPLYKDKTIYVDRFNKLQSVKSKVVDDLIPVTTTILDCFESDLYSMNELGKIKMDLSRVVLGFWTIVKYIPKDSEIEPSLFYLEQRLREIIQGYALNMNHFYSDSERFGVPKLGDEQPIFDILDEYYELKRFINIDLDTYMLPFR